MLVKNSAKLCLPLCALLLSGCAVTVPNTKVCVVSGVLSAGADCVYTLDSKSESLTFDEYLEFLEPQPERPDPKDPTKTLPARGAALCQSADDWNAQKTALEQACKKLGTRCTFAMKQTLSDVSVRLEALQHTAILLAKMRRGMKDRE